MITDRTVVDGEAKHKNNLNYVGLFVILRLIV